MGWQLKKLFTGAAVTACTVLLLVPATASAARVNFRSASGNDSVTEKDFFDQGGLVLRGKCELGTLTVWARSRFDNVMLAANAQRAGAPTARALAFSDLDHGSANQVELNNPAYLNNLDDTTGQIIYARPGGVNVTVDFLAEEMESDLFGTGKACAFTGHAKIVDSSNTGSRVNFRSDDPVPPSSPTFFSGGGLSLRAGPTTNCTSGGHLDVQARTSSADSLIHWAGQYVTIGAYAEEDPSFQTGSSGEQALTGGGLDSASSNHLVYARPSGSKENVTVDWAAAESPLLFDGTKECAFVGSARVAPSGSSHRVNFRADDGQLSLTKFFESGGLQLWGRCNSSLTPQLYVIARTTVENSIIRFNGQQPTNDVASGGSNDFDPGEEPDLFAQMNGYDTSSAGQILYSNPEGRNVAIDFAASAGGVPFNFGKECAFVGTAEKNTP